MRNTVSASALQIMKDAALALLTLLWNGFKGCLTALFLLLAWFAAWGVWEKGSLSFGTVGVIAFLLFLASAPWLIPRMQLPDEPAPRTIAVCGAVIALVCVDLAYSALTYGWKADNCSAPGVLFCYGMNLLYALGGNVLIAASWLSAAALVARGTFKAAAKAAQQKRARRPRKAETSLTAATWSGARHSVQ
jgi:hypothetical protein